MTKYALSLSALLCAGFAGPVFAGEDQVVASTDTKIKWPDYRSKQWVVLKQGPLAVKVAIPVERNNYIPGPAVYDVLIGTVTTYADSAKHPTVAVSEGEILGNGAMIRMLHIRAAGLIAAQVMVNGNWQDIELGSDISIEVIDFKRLLAKKELKGVILRVMDGKDEKLKVVIENKLSNNSRK